MTQQPHEITRPEIAELAGVCRAQLSYIFRMGLADAPASTRKLKHNKLAYDRAEVVAWLAKNDLKQITVSVADRARLDSKKKPRRAIHIEPKPDLQGLPGSKRIKIKKAPDQPKIERKTVHVKERNDYIPPHKDLAWDGSHGSGYVVHIG